MMNSVAPVWDGNETWLVLGGGGLLAVFPLAYAVIMPALYAPIIAMLLALIFRGVAFEFRWRTQRGKFLWDWAFAGGSTLAAFAQGIALGALVQGIPVAGRAYAGGWWDWLTPFSLLTGIALVIGYALLGATWLDLEGRGPRAGASLPLRVDHGRRHAAGHRRRQPVDALPRTRSFMARWFAWPQVLYTAPVPLLVAFSRLRPVPLARVQRRELHAVPGGTRLLRAVLCGARHQLLPLHRADVGHDLGGSSARQQPRLPAGRRGRARPADPRLHRLFLLGLPRQGELRRGLPLNGARPPVGNHRKSSGWTSRLLWFAGLWIASVTVISAVAFVIRAVLRP